MNLRYKIFISLLVIVGLIITLAFLGQEWLGFIILFLVYAPLWLLEIVGVKEGLIRLNGSYIPPPTTTGWVMVVILNILFLIVVSVALEKIINKMKQHATKI